MSMTDRVKVLVDILKHELSLEDDRVVVYNQEFKAPDSGMYIVIGFSSSKLLASNTKFNTDSGQEEHTIKTYANHWIEFTSKDSEAMDRMAEVIAALTSIYSVQKQEENGINIFRNSQVNDLSFIEAPTALYRYRFNIVVVGTDTIIKDVEYFTNFDKTEVLT